MTLIIVGFIGLTVVVFEAGFISIRPTAAADISFISIGLIALGLLIIFGSSAVSMP